MGRRSRRFGAALAALATVSLLGTIAPPPVRAQESPDAAAQRLQTTLREWLGILLGPHVPLAEVPVRLTPQGQGYAVSIPLAGTLAPLNVTLEADGPISASARRLDEARWALDDIRFPSPFSVVSRLPGKNGEQVRSTVTMQQQDQHAVLDPALATTSSWDATIRGYEAKTTRPHTQDTIRIGQWQMHLAAQSAGGGRLDVTEETHGALLTMQTADEKGTISLAVARISDKVHINRLAPEQLAVILRALATDAQPALAQIAAGDEEKTATDISGEAKPPAMKLSAEQRAALHAALDALAEAAADLHGEATLEDVTLRTPQGEAHARQLGASTDIAAPEGRLLVSTRMSLDGLDIPALAASPIGPYLPRHISIAPRVGGVQGAALLQLLTTALESDGHDPSLHAQAEALLRNGPLDVALDDLSLDLGPARLSGTGELRISGPDATDGEAHVTAKGFDALVKALHGTQAAPVLIYLKGLGEQRGEAMVWDIAFHDGHLTVNGNDLPIR
jgi:hypothetical protein